MTRPKGRITRILFGLGVALVIAFGAWTCARAGEKPKTKVLLIGIDAGEWDVLGPLLDQKRVPAFAKLRDEGASGKLRSLQPLTKSPIIWASIATGKVPSKHGVSDFFVKRGEQQRTAARARGDSAAAESDPLVTSNMWRARPIWDILGSLGKKVGVVGWWTTWPAQAGERHADHRLRAIRPRASGAGASTHRTYPESLDSLVLALRRTEAACRGPSCFNSCRPSTPPRSRRARRSWSATSGGSTRPT